MPVQPSSEWFLVAIGACAAFLRVVPGRQVPVQPSSECFLVGIGACVTFLRVVPVWHRCQCSLPQQEKLPETVGSARKRPS